MAKNAVGSLAVLISANAEQFDRGIAKVVTDTNRLHTRIKPPAPLDLGGVVQFSTLDKLAKQAAATREVADAARAGGGLGGLAAGLGGVATAGLGASAVLDTIREQAKLGMAAKAFGLTSQQFTGIAAVARNAGEGSREFVESLTTMSKVIEDGIAGRGDVAADFFRVLGVEARSFAGLRVDQQFFKIFESLQRVQDPAKRVRALMTAFGEDGGKALLNALSQSTAEMRKMAAAAGITEERMAKIIAADKAMREGEAAFNRAKTELAVGSAPAVQAAADAVPFGVTFARKLVGLGQGFTGTVMNTGGGVAQLLGFDFHSRRMYENAQRNIDAGRANFHGGGAASAAVEEAAAADRAAKAMADAAAKRQAEEAWRAGLRHHTGGEFVGPLTQQDQAWKDLGERRKEFDEFAERRRQAQAMRGGGEFARVQTEAGLLRQQLAQGLIGPGGFLDGMGKLVEGLDGVMDDHEVRLPAAVLKGSQEAESLLSRTIAGGNRKDPAERIAAALKALADKQPTKDEMARAFARELERVMPDIVAAEAP